ncbi:MAG: PEP-CTERM sorting domain-containing protein [Phycisphaeraceae bacterium]|nr:PEP-CTERM sorting domain-containing protein [Phycisphaeraceae bacterium]
MTYQALVRAVAALGLAALAGPSAFAQIQSTWENPVSGSWTDAAFWSTPEFPTARGPDTYLAIIDQTGSAYTISLGSAVDLDGLRFTSGNATIDGGGLGTIVVRTDLEFGGATARAIAELLVEGTLRFTSAAGSTLDDTPLCLPGLATARKTGSGTINLIGTSIIEQLAGSLFIIENSGDFTGDSTARWNNDGLIVKQSPGDTRVVGIAFNNTGTVVVEQGAFIVENPVLPSALTLGPATYDIGDGARFDLPGTTLATNEATVIFRGPDSVFDQFSNINTNRGTVRAEGGANVAFTPTLGLVNEGVLIADGNSSRISLGGNLANNGGIVTLLNGGVVSSANGSGSVNNNGGLLQGNGTIQGATILNNGIVSPGNSPGVLITEGDGSGLPHIYQQGPAGTLLIEIGGRTPGIGHDVLEVRGIALLDGVLQLEFLPFTGEPPVTPGDQFQILLAEGIDGRFRDVILNGLGGEGAVEVFINPGVVVVVVVSIPAPGSLALLGLGAVFATRRRRAVS